MCSFSRGMPLVRRQGGGTYGGLSWLTRDWGIPMAKKSITMIKICIFSLSVMFFSDCKNIKKISTSVPVDTISSKQFLAGRNICEVAIANNFKEIKPPMVPWATDLKDPYSESYFIDGKKLTILQPLKRFDLPDSNRRYFYDGKEIKTVRVLFDSLKFNFNSVTFDYGYSPQNIFRNKNSILLRNEPADWSGLIGQYRFIQLFDLRKMICYDFFVNYYACLNDHSSKE